jgi:altronate dehydratase small subunit
MAKKKSIVINQKDNVATALADLKAGDVLEEEFEGKLKKIELKQNVPFGHKISLTRIKKDSPIIKYGEVIGNATELINEGDYVHIHNVKSNRGRGDLEGGKE